MFDKNIFSERLSYLRKTHNVSALTIAKELGISKAAISQFENCANYPHVNTLTSLADYFHVSIDYLTGRTDCPDIVTKDKDGRFIAIETMQPPQTAAKEDVDRIANEIIQEHKDAFQELSK